MDEVEVLSSGAFLATFELLLDDPVEHSHEDESCHDQPLSQCSARTKRWRLLFRRLKCQPSDGSRSLSNGGSGIPSYQNLFPGWF